MPPLRRIEATDSPRSRAFLTKNRVSRGESLRGNSLLRLVSFGFRGRPISREMYIRLPRPSTNNSRASDCPCKVSSSSLESLQHSRPREPQVFAETVDSKPVCMCVDPIASNAQAPCYLRDGKELRYVLLRSPCGLVRSQKGEMNHFYAARCRLARPGFVVKQIECLRIW